MEPGDVYEVVTVQRGGRPVTASLFPPMTLLSAQSGLFRQPRIHLRCLSDAAAPDTSYARQRRATRLKTGLHVSTPGYECQRQS